MIPNTTNALATAVTDSGIPSNPRYPFTKMLEVSNSQPLRMFGEEIDENGIGPYNDEKKSSNPDGL